MRLVAFERPHVHDEEMSPSYVDELRSFVLCKNPG